MRDAEPMVLAGGLTADDGFNDSEPNLIVQVHRDGARNDPK